MIQIRSIFEHVINFYYLRYEKETTFYQIKRNLRNTFIALILKKFYLIIIAFVVMLVLVFSCGTSKKAHKVLKKKALVETTALGKNKLYFSKSYQKKLKHRSKKNRRKRRK